MALAAPQRDARVLHRITDQLAYINSLYTVYTRIFVYDTAGSIVASSRPDADGHAVVGTSVDANTLAQVHALRSDQDYCVTPFASTVLYGDRPTYVYHAAIRHPSDDTVVVGGIGIVFDAETEFLAMLRGGLGNKSDANALFALPASQISSVSRGNREARICLLGLQHQTAGQGSVWVYDLGYLIHNRPATIAPNSQVIIVRHGGQTFGLLVDALHGVPEFNRPRSCRTPLWGILMPHWSNS